jgi:hypothetical protein
VAKFVILNPLSLLILGKLYLPTVNFRISSLPALVLKCKLLSSDFNYDEVTQLKKCTQLRKKFLHLRVYMKRKPRKYGIKIFQQCDAESG